MTWTEFDAWLVKTVRRASEERRFAFARETSSLILATRFASQIDFSFELDERAREAFDEARSCLLNLDVCRLRTLLGRIDAGVLTDHNMDCILLWMYMAMEEWTNFFETSDYRPVLILARVRLDMIDWEVGAPLDDYLGHASMKAERNRIDAALSG